MTPTSTQVHVDHPPKPRSGRPALAAALSLLALTLLGCSRDEVSHFRVPKPAPPSLAGSPPSGQAAATRPAGLEAPPTEGSVLRWTLPNGWTESLTGGMRYATLVPPVKGRIEATVVVLPGPAGGELANVNRWRGQIGLSPIDEATLASARQQLTSPAGALALYDFASEGDARTRLIAALASAEGKTWFVKMSGDAEPVGAARRDFLRLLESLRFDRPN